MAISVGHAKAVLCGMCGKHLRAAFRDFFTCHPKIQELVGCLTNCAMLRGEWRVKAKRWERERVC